MLFAPPLGAASAPPVLNDFWRFHGMLCGPSAAQRCVDSFAGGTILFMPNSYKPESFNTADIATRLPYEVLKLTVIKYYWLVLWSLTGLSSLLRQTKTVEAVDFFSELGKREQQLAASPHPLAVDPRVVDALERRHGPITLTRRFEFRFRLIGLWVAMYHYLSTDPSGEKLHLVEVYKLNKLACAAWLWGVAALVLEFVLRRALV